MFNLFKKKKQELIGEEKQSFASILLGYQIILDRINKPDISNDPSTIVLSLLSCGLDETLTKSSLLGLSISVLSLKREIDLMSKMLVDIMSFAETRNAETCSFVSSKLTELIYEEAKIVKNSETEIIKHMKALI